MGFHDKWRTQWGFVINGGQGRYFMISGWLVGCVAA